MQTMLDHALEYHRHGWQVMPCENKQPLLDTWGYLEDFRVKEETITEWWTEWPEAQIALVCGPLSGVTVVDVDWLKDKEKTILYDKSIKPEELSDRLVGSPTSITGSLGRHVFLNFFDVKNSTKAVHSQIDVKSGGGYVILPPSLHENGRRYAWDETKVSWPSKLLAPPQKLVDACKKAEVTPKDWGKLIRGISEGARNTSGSQVCGALIRSFRNDLGTAWSMFELWNKGNTPPMTERELKAEFNSILKKDYARNARFYRRNA